MATKNNRRTQMTRLLLKTALTELMQKKPLTDITIKDICEQADLNRTTFYLHYTDQFALLQDIENEVQEKTLDYLKNVRPAEEAPEMIEDFLQYIKSHSDLFRVLFCGAGSEDFRRRFIQTAVDNLRVNIPTVKGSPEEPYVLCFLMQGSAQIIKEWIIRDFDLSPRELADLIYQVCNGAVPGRTLFGC